jgi:predicted TIM-barrel fold metal-dependent hydrolase
MKIDHHIHIGQFYEKYYAPVEILQIVADTGIEKCLYSSTSSCNDGVKYTEIEKETDIAAKHFSTDRMQALLWFIPAYIAQGLTVEKAFSSFPYHGIKIHPGAQRWDLSDRKEIDCLHSLFGFADAHHLPVLIHTGEGNFEKPAYFEQFFPVYKKAKIILAHCRPAAETIKMFSQYSVYGDTAFAPEERIKEIVSAGYADRLLFGTDFPITHYFAQKYFNSDLSLCSQYEKDIKDINDLNIKKWDIM